MKVIIDTNVVLDYFQGRVPFNKNAKVIISDASLRKFDAFVTSKSLADIHYVLRHDFNNETEARKFLKAVLLFSSILDSKGEESILAIDSNIKDYEDAMMEETAFNNQVDVIVTRNKKDFKNSRVPAITPEEFIDTFYKDGVYI